MVSVGDDGDKRGVGFDGNDLGGGGVGDGEGDFDVGWSGREEGAVEGGGDDGVLDPGAEGFGHGCSRGGPRVPAVEEGDAAGETAQGATGAVIGVDDNVNIKGMI